MSDEKKPQQPVSPVVEEQPEQEPPFDDDFKPVATWPAGRFWELTMPPDANATLRSRRT